MFKTIRNSVLILALLGLAAPVVQAGAAPMELTASSPMMATHPVMAQFTLPFFKKWEEAANNTIKVTYFNPGTICAPIDLLPAAEQGSVNIVSAGVAAQPAMFPAYSVANLPLMFVNSRAMSLALPEAMETLPQLQKELANWYTLTAGGSVPSNLLTITKQVRTLEDLQGMKIGVYSNDTMNVIKELGGVPVFLQMSDTYLAMQRGMVDGCLMPSPSFRSTKVTEVGKYLTICNIQCSPVPMMMSKATYDSLPAEAKKALDDIGGYKALSASVGPYPDYFADDDTQWVVDNHKVQVYELPAEELARWVEAVKIVDQDWIARAERQGVEDPAGMLKAFRAIAEKYNNLELQKATLDSYRDQLGAFFPSEEVYKKVYGE